MTLSLDEVVSGAATTAELAPPELKALLKKKPIPYMRGPEKQIYIVDHHDLEHALWSLRIPEAILGDRLADWSDKETKEFWRLTESNEGNRRPYAAIPASIADLTDNSGGRLGGAYAARRSKTSIRHIRSSCGAITSAPS